MLISSDKSVCDNNILTLRDKLLNTAIIFREVRNVCDFLLMHTLHLVAVAFGSLGTSNHFFGLEGAKLNFFLLFFASDNSLSHAFTASLLYKMATVLHCTLKQR